MIRPLHLLVELLRRAIRRLRPRGERTWLRFAGLVETGDPNSSQSVDEIVYNSKRK